MITWLASYPKSGNTWLRILLTNYLRDAEIPADINAMEGGPIASARFWFDEWAGFEASVLSDTVVERLRPEVYRCMVREEQKMLFMKVHDAWKLTDRGEALFPADVSSGVICILRNPLDLATSCAHHWGISVEKAVANLCDPGFALARSREGLSDQLRQFLGSWSSHVQSWLDESGLPVHLLRYEDLRADPLATFGAVVDFCGLPRDEARIRKAVAFSDFAELRKQEMQNGFRERSCVGSASFFRRGQAGAWRDELPPGLCHAIVDSEGEMMRRFGYLDDAGQPK